MFKWITVILLLLFVYHVREVFPPFIVGAIFSYLLYPLVKTLHDKLRLPPFWAVLIIYAGTGTIIGFSFFHGLPLLHHEAEGLFKHREVVIHDLVEQVTRSFGMNVNVDETTHLILEQVQNSIGNPEEISHVAGLVSKSLLSLLVCAVTSIYMLVDSRRVGRFFMRFIPSGRRATVVSLLGQMDVMFRKYVWGQLGLITLMSCIAFAILSSFHIKYALLIALVTGFLEIVPVLGPLLAILIASGFAIAQLGLPQAGWVPLCYWIARLVEDYVVVPNTIGHAVELHPLAVIFAVVVGETMAGALGMLIAIPVAASIKVIIDFCYPPTAPVFHHEKRNPLQWMIDMFKSPPPKSEKDSMAEQAKLDALAIGSMHEGASGTGSLDLTRGTAYAAQATTSEQGKYPIIRPSGESPAQTAERRLSQRQGWTTTDLAIVEVGSSRAGGESSTPDAPGDTSAVAASGEKANAAVESKVAEGSKAAVEQKSAPESKAAAESKSAAEPKAASETKSVAQIKTAAESKAAVDPKPAAEAKTTAKAPVEKNSASSREKPETASPQHKSCEVAEKPKVAPDAGPAESDKKPAKAGSSPATQTEAKNDKAAASAETTKGGDSPKEEQGKPPDASRSKKTS